MVRKRRRLRLLRAVAAPRADDCVLVAAVRHVGDSRARAVARGYGDVYCDVCCVRRDAGLLRGCFSEAGEVYASCEEGA